MAGIIALIVLSIAIALSSAQDGFARQDLGVHHFGDADKPFAYLQATLTIPVEPMPQFNDQYLYFYFGLAKEKLSAHVIVLFCANVEGCWGHTAQPGYNIYAEVSQPEGVGYLQFAGGEKLPIEPGQKAQVTIIQSDDYLSLNVTKLSGKQEDSFFDIYGTLNYISIDRIHSFTINISLRTGANDGGLVDIIAGVNLQYDASQSVDCGDYNSAPFIISDILAVESDGNFIKDIDFKQDANDTNTCGGVIDVGAYGRTLNIIGSK